MMIESLRLLSLLGLVLGSPEADPGVLYAAAPEDRGQFIVGGKGSYNYGYNTGDGIAKVEVGHPDGTKTGSYRYFDPYGRQVVRSYIADEKGFRVLGNDLPISVDTPAIGNIGAQTLTAPVEGDHSNVNIVQSGNPDIVILDRTSSDPCSTSSCSGTRTSSSSCSSSGGRGCSSSSSSCSSSGGRGCSSSSSSCSSSGGRGCTGSSSSSSCSSSGGRNCNSSSSSCSSSGGRRCNTPSRCSSSCSSSSRRCCSSSSAVRSCCSSTRRSCCSSSSSCSWQRNCCPSPCSTGSDYSQYFYQRQREEAISRQDALIKRQEEHLAQLREQKRKLLQSDSYKASPQFPIQSGGGSSNYFYSSVNKNYDFPAGFLLDDKKKTVFRPLYVSRFKQSERKKAPFIIGHAK